MLLDLLKRELTEARKIVFDLDQKIQFEEMKQRAEAFTEELKSFVDSGRPVFLKRKVNPQMFNIAMDFIYFYGVLTHNGTRNVIMTGIQINMSQTDVDISISELNEIPFKAYDWDFSHDVFHEHEKESLVFINKTLTDLLGENNFKFTAKA